MVAITVICFLVIFFISHYVFRWRSSNDDYYTSKWDQSSDNIERLLSQRIQEDTCAIRFKLYEGLGVSLTKIRHDSDCLLPNLWGLWLRKGTSLWIGEGTSSLGVYRHPFGQFGTLLLALSWYKSCLDLELKISRVEARLLSKGIVYTGEDHDKIVGTPIHSWRSCLLTCVKNYYFPLYTLIYLYFKCGSLMAIDMLVQFALISN